ncbi:hypothetical protein FBQ87_04650 [Sphingobacteriales bacterium CHB3]|nr:hypothetical protein [Sphingobacteriales bacterium CHB3]
MKKYPQSALSCLLAGLIVVLPSAVRADETGVEAVPPYGPVVDESADLLKVPAGLSGRDGFVVAKQPPRITFSTFTGLPTLRDTKKKGGLWSLWGEGVRAANGKFYVGVGNHRGRDANCYLYEYDPATHAHRQSVRSARCRLLHIVRPFGTGVRVRYPALRRQCSRLDGQTSTGSQAAPVPMSEQERTTTRLQHNAASCIPYLLPQGIPQQEPA